MTEAVSNGNSPDAGARILYISYDGVTDPLGRSQILPYLTGLAAKGYEITLLTSDKPDRYTSDAERIRAICEPAGIDWVSVEFRRSPPVLGSMINQHRLRRKAFQLQRERNFDIVHCRSYIPGGIGLALKQRFGTKFLFDIRGFWPDEKVEGNNWDMGNPVYRAAYRHFKRLEDRMFRGADHVVSLTYAGREQMLTRPQWQPSGPEITVIPCCVDFETFPLRDMADRAEGRALLGISEDASVLAYLGSVGSWYMLDEMLDFFKVYAEREANAHFLFVTREPPEPILKAAEERGIGRDQMTIRPASREEVPKFMAATDLGIFFIKPVFSKTSSSPTKMGEILALGLPLVTNRGVGDVGQIVDETGCGVAITEFDEASYAKALNEVQTMDIDVAVVRERAVPWFDVDIGIERYAAAYAKLMAG